MQGVQDSQLMRKRTSKTIPKRRNQTQWESVKFWLKISSLILWARLSHILSIFNCHSSNHVSCSCISAKSMNLIKAELICFFQNLNRFKRTRDLQSHGKISRLFQRPQRTKDYPNSEQKVVIWPLVWLSDIALPTKSLPTFFWSTAKLIKLCACPFTSKLSFTASQNAYQANVSAFGAVF